MALTIDESLDLLVGWIPGQGRTLAAGARNLGPALLYADNTVVLCPMSDDAYEMTDYFELDDALPGAVEFRALDSIYPVLDAQGEPFLDERGQPSYEYLAPKVHCG